MVGARSLPFHQLLLIWVLFMLGLMNFNEGSGNATIQCIESEIQALLNFKKALDDPYNLLSSWTSGEDCCRWRGVGCDNHTGHVVMLNLQPHFLMIDGYAIIEELMSGEISSSLLELPYLSHLDLSYNFFENMPDFIGSLSKLTYLDLSSNNFNGTFPYQVGNLSMLQYLDLSKNDEMRADSIEWLDSLSSLRVLHLSMINFGKDVDWLKSIKLHPSLSTLELSYCKFPEINPSSISHVNPSKSLTALYLLNNNFNTSINSWLFNVSTAIVDLNIRDDQLKGPFPYSFGDMISLVHLDLSYNQLEGGIPSSFGNLCHLKTLDLYNNNLSVPFSDILENLRCTKNSLEILWLSRNQLKGSIPDITELEALRELHINDNHLDGSFPKSFKHFSKLRILNIKRNRLLGSLPESIGELSALQILDASSNKFNGVISEAHLSNLSRLQQLDLSYNSLALSFNSDWTPSFQLDTIKLSSCKLGPHFPIWLQSQRNFSYLDISNSEISDVAPIWFWNFPSKLLYLNLSFNHIYGKVPNLLAELHTFPAVDLSSNFFYGPIPQFLSNTTVLNLSKNMFTGSLSFFCALMDSPLNYLDLSDNMLSGSLTDCWVQKKMLNIINLENNHFSGTIPSSMGSLSSIQTLRLRNNSLTGELPSLKNCFQLQLLDLGENKLTGKIPTWIGENLTNLIVLRLRSNEFYGSIPSTICHLSFIQVLDISFNNLSGIIPSCLDNLTAMAQKQSLHRTISYDYALYYDYWIGNGNTFGSTVGEYFDYASIIWRGTEQEYGKTLGLLKIIDLSNNNLAGKIPEQVTSLLGIISLNLSRNNLIGAIPDRMGQLKALESLDLSHNQFSGQIPISMADLSFLGNLDLSDNQLTGRIPSGTQLQSFSASAYSKNSGLCGPPLPNECPGQGTLQDPSSIDDGIEEGEEWFERSWIYAGAGIGFAVGFWGFYGSLMISNSWRHVYFQFLNNLVD